MFLIHVIAIVAVFMVGRWSQKAGITLGSAVSWVRGLFSKSE